MGKVSLKQVSCGVILFTVVACTLEVGGLLLKSRPTAKRVGLKINQKKTELMMLNIPNL